MAKRRRRTASRSRQSAGLEARSTRLNLPLVSGTSLWGRVDGVTAETSRNNVSCSSTGVVQLFPLITLGAIPQTGSAITPMNPEAIVAKDFEFWLNPDVGVTDNKVAQVCSWWMMCKIHQNDSGSFPTPAAFSFRDPSNMLEACRMDEQYFLDYNTWIQTGLLSPGLVQIHCIKKRVRRSITIKAGEMLAVVIASQSSVSTTAPQFQARWKQTRMY
jgi:hypothetical protein